MTAKEEQIMTRLNWLGLAWIASLACNAYAQAPTASAAPAASTAVAASAPAPKPPAGNVLRVGVIGPLSGGSADFGTPMVNGVKLAVEEINAVGGYLGRKVELVVKDDQGNPDAGLKASQELIAEQVIGAIGFCNTGVAVKSLEVYQNAKVPLIVPCATGTPVTAKFPARESYIFRNSAKDDIQAPFVVEDIVKRGLTKVAIFHDSTGYGKAGREDVVKALAAKGLKPVYETMFDLKVADLTVQLKAAREAGANVIFGYTVGPEQAVIAKSRAQIGWRVPHVGAWPLTFPNFLIGGGDAAEGALMATTFIAEPTNERRAAFLSAYSRKYKVTRVPSAMSAAQAYDATYLLMYALFSIKDGVVTGPRLKEALETIPRTYYGVVSTYQAPFSVNDKDAVSGNMLLMGTVKGGVITYAYPEDAKKAFVSQRKQ
jgi:branched-chain amino acid transport system substrate-binding protein